ncbi:MAG: type I methionyl aminopeptidase [Armatimonadetes bacterium]|nr:type I methionyl aminopeptidase [Armatimonadota bacterium]
MPLLKTPDQIAKMKESGRIVARTLRLTSETIVPGKTTPKELDALADRLIREEGGIPSFLGYRGYPAATCISVNNVVVHGIPTDQPLMEGDIISLDFGVVKDGWHADGAWTFPVGQISAVAQKLLNVTRESLNQGIAKARPGNTVGDIGAAVQKYVESHGFGVVRELVGHGIGQKLHDEPHNVPMFGKPGKGERLREGMCICIEPMINEGTYKVNTLNDGWSVVTADDKLSAHFEHTVAITKAGPVILTTED